MLVEISVVKLAPDLRRMPVLAANQTEGVLQLFIFLQRPGMTVTGKDLGHETLH